MTRLKTKKNENVEKTIIDNDDESKTIKDISDYINRCSHYSDLYSSEIVVFRGETEDFGETSCIPGIFRKDYLKNNPYFEKNILDEMSANGIAIGSTYLEKAINAQHDGFPSRLLDVSYNALIGLQFAVTPYYKYAVKLHIYRLKPTTFCKHFSLILKNNNFHYISPVFNIL
mgnify:CR=1 FL=1